MRKEIIRLEAGKKFITTLVKDYVDLQKPVKLVSIQVLQTNAAVLCCEGTDHTITDIRDDLIRLVPTQEEVLSQDKAKLAYMIRSSVLGRSISLAVCEGELLLGEREEIVILGFPEQMTEVSIGLSSI